MKNKLKYSLLRGMTHNIGLKFLALVFSVGLWFVVNNITDPVTSKPFYNVSVEILNEDLITNEGKVYEVLDGTDTISVVRVRGKTSVLDSITREDIKATADLSELTFMNTVAIQISSARSNAELEFDTSIDNLKLEIEDVKRIQMVINTSTIGNPADGYIVGTVTPSLNIVRISGPESLVNTINRVEAVANIGNYAYTSDIDTSVDLQLFDAEGNEIKNSALRLNISTINVAISILATKEVPLNFNITGEPQYGYVTTGEIVSVPETVTIAGRKATLDGISQLNVTDAALDITDLTNDLNTIVNIKKLLPTGVQFADSTFGGNVSVTVTIEPTITEQFAVPVRNIAIANIPEGYEATVEELADAATYQLTIVGIEADMKKLQARNIIGVLDLNQYAEDNNLTEWAAGRYICRLNLNLTGEYTTATSYSLTVVLSEVPESSEDTE